MKTRGKKSKGSIQEPTLELNSPLLPTTPEFIDLLRRPVVKLALPSDFDASVEAGHLVTLWNKSSALKKYKFGEFIHAGGSGMVFKVYPEGNPTPQALKIAREKLYKRTTSNPNAVTKLSPLEDRELRALERLSHANIVHLFNAIADEKGVFAILTSFVEDPKPLDEYLRLTLEGHPDPTGKKGIHSFSPQRLDGACVFLVDRFLEVADALSHMHKQNLFHCDIKPANILIDNTKRAILTDLGACTDPREADTKGNVRIQFTWTYAHPELTDLVSDPKGITGGGLKASANVGVSSGLGRYDLFALGRTIQEALARLVYEFGERCYASYNFRYLHIIASLLLDGRNTPLEEGIRLQDGRRFVKDAALDYPPELFARKKIVSADQLIEGLERFSRSYWPYEETPELDSWQPNVINTGCDRIAPFTQRTAAIANHPAVRRLKLEPQLGWIREVYPGATHNRWSHTLGVFSAVADYYSTLLADPEVPTARILLNPVDVEHGLLAALLHDIGQTGFGHDFETAVPNLYSHESLISRLLEDKSWGEPTLRDIVARHWPRVDLKRVQAIHGYDKDTILLDPVDGLARDMINGPIDADKLDYLVRDSISCGISYGLAIDRSRFLRALTLEARKISGHARLAIAYRAKGTPAIESLLLARYQMYGAAYWHHTFRCIQAMLVHAAATTFGEMKATKLSLRGHDVEADLVRQLFYMRVICGHSITRCRQLLAGKTIPGNILEEMPNESIGDRSIEFIWRFSDKPIRKFLERLSQRDLFQRVFEISVGDLGESGDYSALATALSPLRRIASAGTLQKTLLDSIYKKIQQRGKVESIAEDEARLRYQELDKSASPLVVIDFPTRGIPEEKNVPHAIGDPARKYISGRGAQGDPGRNVFPTVRKLQISIASIRVFAAKELHELVIRYLEPRDIQNCIESVLHEIKRDQ